MIGVDAVFYFGKNQCFPQQYYCFLDPFLDVQKKKTALPFPQYLKTPKFMTKACAFLSLSTFNRAFSMNVDCFSWQILSIFNLKKDFLNSVSNVCLTNFWTEIINTVNQA